MICVENWHLVHDGCAKHPQHAKHASSRGSGEHASQENFENLMPGD